MDLRRNIVFSSLIKIGGRLSEFNFRKRGDLSYDVDTSDERGNRVFLKMEKQGADWKIMDTAVPGWLLKCEGLLDEAIKTEEPE
jgi:hypothetical protein